jgi:hypothetical protein
MHSDHDPEAVARFLEKGGPVAANVSDERARECLRAINNASSGLREKFESLVFMSPETGDFDPYKKFWGAHDQFHSIPRFEMWTEEREISPLHIRAKEPCFTIYDRESKPQHYRGLEVFIGYEEMAEHRWNRVVYLRGVNDRYKNVGWPRNDKTMVSCSMGIQTIRLEELSAICPQAVADVNRAFRAVERSEEAEETS